MNLCTLYKHDCDACQFLGTVEGPDPYHEAIIKKWDLYFCPRCDGGSLIARYDSEPSHYKSTPRALLATNKMHPVLHWALALQEMKERT